MARIALLLGMFIVPLALLVLGHRLRDRTPPQRGAFWGGVIGHTAAIIVAATALHFPPVLWSSQERILIAFWSMLLGGVVGAAIGWIRAARTAA